MLSVTVTPLKTCTGPNKTLTWWNTELKSNNTELDGWEKSETKVYIKHKTTKNKIKSVFENKKRRKRAKKKFRVEERHQE